MASVPVKPVPVQPGETTAERFRRLAATWRAETAYLSSSTALIEHPAYQEIIRLGPEVVPLLLQDLEKEPDHWFWALQVLTGVNPVPAADAGNLDKMAQDWIRWGHAHGY
jgi:hypothetical protein